MDIEGKEPRTAGGLASISLSFDDDDWNFDKVDHDKIMGLLRRRISDRVLLRLVREYLQAGVVCNGHYSKRDQGTPQGGPLSPLLSNILLTELDNELSTRDDRPIPQGLCPGDREGREPLAEGRLCGMLMTAACF